MVLLFLILTAVAEAVTPSSHVWSDAGWTRVELSDFLREDIRFPLLNHRWNSVETRKVLLLVSIPPHCCRRLELLSARRLREEGSPTAAVVVVVVVCVRRRRVVGGCLIIVGGFDGCRLGDLNRRDDLDLVL